MNLQSGAGLHLSGKGLTRTERPRVYVDPMRLAWMSADAGVEDSMQPLGGEVRTNPDYEISTLLPAGAAATPAVWKLETPCASARRPTGEREVTMLIVNRSMQVSV